MKPAGTHHIVVHGSIIHLSEKCKCCNYTGNINPDCVFCHGKGVTLTTNGVHLLEFVREFLGQEKP